MTSSEDKRNVIQSKMLGWRHSALVRYALFLLLMIMFYVSLAPKLLPEKYNITIDMPSEKEILAPTQIQNTKATLQAQEAAAEAEKPVYTRVSLRNDVIISEMLDQIARINQDDQISREDKVSVYRQDLPRIFQAHIQNFIMSSRNSSNYSSNFLDELRSRITEQAYQLSEETFVKIPQLKPEDIAEMKPVASDIVSRLMYDSFSDAQTARAKVAEQVSSSPLSKRISREIVQELARYVITANKFYDGDATKEAKVRSRENTAPVYIKQGDVLVAKRQIITQEMYSLLKANDLLNNKINYWPQAGLALLSLLLCIGLYMYLRQSETTVRFKYSNQQLLMLVLIFLVTILSMTIISLLHNEQRPFIGYLAPVAIGAMLITLLLDMSLAYICSIIFSVIASIVLNIHKGQIFDYYYGLFTLITSFVAIFVINRASQRSSILKAGIMVALFGALTVGSLIMLRPADMDQTSVLYSVGFSFAGGLLDTIMVIGLMPFFEVTFGILSALKLVELSNPNHPLLRKLLTETPGTYHHSVMVGNLSEAAAEAIGANGLLCRVGSYYHDVGKTKRPDYFIENQNGIDNPHDLIDPKLSKSIIIAHAVDGAQMQKEYKLPKPLRDIAEQHHGTTFLHYFYHKALKQAEQQGMEPDFTEDDFRYPGPNAQSKEAAIVGIADSVEAAVRSLHKPTVRQVETVIEKIIKSRLDDYQFKECDLTMRELDIVGQTLKETVMGIFHSRIEYPNEEKLIKKNDEKEREKHDSRAGLEQ